MPLTRLDPRPALICIDLQQGIVNQPTVHPTDVIVQHAARLAEAFRQRGLPVVLVNVTGGAPGRVESRGMAGERPADWSQLVAELRPQPTDILISKQVWGAFTHGDLATRLRQLDVTQTVIAGVSTSIGVESTARQAYELGFNVVLATDAMTDTRADAHDNSIERIFPRLGERASSDEIIALLDRR
ncbi:isochorismatase family protein [Pseudoxanthomonas dokdonensis]|uniref:Hydrolase n=1 Tax=Pseudoxanthomonas dokdonensis TaxID=344882 RepID=A0A0R0CUL7_9GAMM|nr:isochorismatase family protein [Pseudoxanthomonas dokdonensis]KRG69799.1 hydrolase [Pseudoxanthomonas dokdonensis]